VGDLEWNRGLAKTAIRELGTRESGITVLPELMSSGYVFDSPDEARSCAEPADGPTVSEWTADAASYGIVIVGGFAELGEEYRRTIDQRLTESAFVRDVHPTTVKLADGGVDASALGAASVVLHRYLTPHHSAP